MYDLGVLRYCCQVLTAGLTLPLMRCREAALHRRVMLAEIRTDLQWVRYGRAMLSVDKCLTKNKKIIKIVSGRDARVFRACAVDNERN